MIDPWKILFIAACSLALANVFVLVVPWKRVAVQWRRTRKWYAVHWSLMSEEDRQFWRWYGRAAWVSLLLVAAAPWKGW